MLDVTPVEYEACDAIDTDLLECETQVEVEAGLDSGSEFGTGVDLGTGMPSC